MSFTKVDALLRPEHSALLENDECIFLREYRAGSGYEGETNSLIWNLKKKPSERTTKGGYHYKWRAIKQVSAEFAKHLNPRWLKTATLVPIPCSKAIDHPDYDDRMERICRGIGADIDVRNLVTQTQSTEYSHATDEGQRLSVDELIKLYEIDENLTEPAPTNIGIVDDVLTVGRHFRAMSTVIIDRFPQARITGMFIARTIHPNPFDNVEISDLI